MPDLLAALLPCAWGYVHIAQELAQQNPPDDQRYVDWIAQYASREFADAADRLKDELNRVAANVFDEKRKRLIDLFVLSSRYEWEFWEMCWNGEAWRP
jgi:thiaminase/transcriptional activator TenA